MNRKVSACLFLKVACAFCAAVLSVGSAWAQSYPTKPVHIIVPFAPGGITDIVARALAQRLSEDWGQQVVVENKPGGTGQVGAEAVAKASPDGYTLLVTADATFVTNPHFYSKLPYDALNDFAPITGLGISPQALVVNPALPVRTLSDLIELARSKPGEINYGTFGIGSSGHLNIILLEGMTGSKFTAVHYRGAAPAITDVIGGHIQMIIVSIGLVAQPWQSGQLKVLGFGRRALRNIPTCPRSRKAAFPVMKRAHGMGWRRQRTRRPMLSTSSIARRSASSTIRPFAINFSRPISSSRS